MDLSARLRRLEERVDDLLPEEGRCIACGAPEPSIPSIPRHSADGSISPSSIIAPLVQCWECGGYGGHTALSYDPETGRTRGRLIVLCDHEAEKQGLSFKEWLERPRWRHPCAR